MLKLTTRSPSAGSPCLISSTGPKPGTAGNAGSYDPQDFLGRLIGDKPWVRLAEQSMYECYDHNFFASEFHIELFTESLDMIPNKTKRVGWPMEYLKHSLDSYKSMPKKDIVLFPHRIAPEKQVEIFRDLGSRLPQYEFIVCQDKQLSKNEYHNLLGEAKLVFSANLQETLGISWYEGVLVDTIPMMPNRLSYKEMALPDFLYPSDWTLSWEHYHANKLDLMNKIKDYMDNYDSYLLSLDKQRTKLNDEFFNGAGIYSAIK